MTGAPFDDTAYVEPFEHDRREAAAIFDELRDYEQCFIERPSRTADRYDELHRRLGLLATFYGINIPDASGRQRLTVDDLVTPDELVKHDAATARRIVCAEGEALSAELDAANERVADLERELDFRANWALKSERAIGGVA